MKRLLLFLYFLPSGIIETIFALWEVADKLNPLERVEQGVFIYFKKHNEE